MEEAGVDLRIIWNNIWSRTQGPTGAVNVFFVLSNDLRGADKCGSTLRSPHYVYGPCAPCLSPIEVFVRGSVPAQL